MSRRRLRQLFDLWVESLVRGYPWVPVVAAFGALVVLPPATVVGLAILAYTLVMLVDAPKKKPTFAKEPYE